MRNEKKILLPARSLSVMGQTRQWDATGCNGSAGPRAAKQQDKMLMLLSPAQSSRGSSWSGEAPFPLSIGGVSQGCSDLMIMGSESERMRECPSLATF